MSLQTCCDSSNSNVPRPLKLLQNCFKRLRNPASVCVKMRDQYRKEDDNDNDNVYIAQFIYHLSQAEVG